LHVLGMPPAFNLSQDQTLQLNLALLDGRTHRKLLASQKRPNPTVLFN
jgi:hypothetical protein